MYSYQKYIYTYISLRHYLDALMITPMYRVPVATPLHKYDHPISK